MKIEGPGKTAPKSTSRSRKKGSAGVDFDGLITKSGENSAAEGAQATTGAAAISGIDALLSVQESDDYQGSGQGQQMARQRADALLDQLDQLRAGILSGTVSRHNLVALARIIETQRHQVQDPALLEVLDEIDLRAQVELAKFTAKD